VSVTGQRFDTLPEQSVAPAELARDSLVDIYHKYFQYRVARSEQDRRDAFQLRYAVYCEETGYLNKSDNPSGLERDEHDAHSQHSILVHTDSNRIAGTVRLVMPRRDLPCSALPARLFSTVLDSLPESVLPRLATGEISRFAIHPSFRRRLGDGLYASIFNSADKPEQDFDPRRVIPHITLGLIASIFEMASTTGITHLCAVIDPALLRLLGRLGLHFHKAGPVIDFHGPRQPVYSDMSELLARTLDEQPEIYHLIVAGCNKA
jgi:N-acyl amino acid synthase of PEP-CTERM/exosortase system